MINISSLFAMVFSMSLIGSVTAGIIILIKALFKNKLSPSWHYYIWFLLILILVIPHAPKINFDIQKIFNQQAKQTYIVDKAINKVPSKEITKEPGTIITTDNNKSNLAGKEEYLNSASDKNVKLNSNNSTKVKQGFLFRDKSFRLNYFMLGIVWVVGAIVMLTYIVIVSLLFYRNTSNKELCNNEQILKIFEQCKKELGIKKKVKIIYDKSNGTPFVFGLVNPSLILPAGIIKNIDIEEIRFVFLHELSHIKRKDLLVNWIIILLQSIHWFNPIIWAAFKKMKQDCEISCDMQVLGHLNASEYNQYGQSIIKLVILAKLAGRTAVLPAAAGIIGKTETKRRIKMISVFNKTSFKKVKDFTGLAAACALIFTTAGSLSFIQDNIVNAAATQSNKTAAQPKAISAKLSKFNSILRKNNNIEEALKYINLNLKSLSSSDMTTAINNLESQQLNYLPILEKKYEVNSIQQKFISEYNKYGSISKIYSTKDTALKNLLNETKGKGYKLDTAEGMYFPVVDYEVYKKYVNYVTKDISAYIDIMAVESNKPSARDAGIVIGWNELIRRTLNQEKFVKSYKGSTRYTKVKALYNNYLNYILYGANNTPLFDYVDKGLNPMNPEAKKAYMDAVKNVGDSKLLGIIRDYLKVIQKANYKLTKDVKTFRDKVSKSNQGV